MVRAVIIALIALAIGGAFGSLILRDPGYVMVAYGRYSFETSLWVGLVFAFGLYLLLRLTLWIVGVTLGSWGMLRRFGIHRSTVRARQRTVNGLTELVRGNFSQARRLLAGSADRSEMPLINYLGAAMASDRLGDVHTRDELLALAHESEPEPGLGVGLTQAQLQLAAGRFEHGLAILIRLRKLAPRNPLILQLLLETFERVGDWEGVAGVMRDARRQSLIDQARLEQLRLRVAEHRLVEDAARLDAAGDDRVRALMAAYRRLSRQEREQPGLVRTQVGLLLDAAGSDGAAEAERLLRDWLPRHFDRELVAVYGRIDGRDGERQLLAAEGWLKERPGDAVLLLALGRIALRLGQPDKAMQYLAASAAQASSVDVLAELGELAHANGDPAAANRYFQQALAQAGFLVRDGGAALAVTAAPAHRRDDARAAEPVSEADAPG